MAQHDKRKHSRVAYNVRILINNSLKVMCNDISSGGVFVHGNRSLVPGSTVQVTFPDDGLTLNAEIRTLPYQGGMGLMFTTLNEKQHDKLELIIMQAKTTLKVKTDKIKVLIVEDNPTVRNMTVCKLTADGLFVIEATPGVDIMKLISTQNIEVVIMDLNTGQIDGIELLRTLKTEPIYEGISVIALSSKYTPEEQTIVMEVGADAFLPKITTSPAKLLALVKSLRP